MADSILIDSLEVSTRIGVSEAERSQPQKLLVSIELFLGLKDAGDQDDVHRSIDYALVAEAVKKIATKERKTIEAFAEDAAQMILQEFEPRSVKVGVQKFILPNARSVSVTIQRP